MTKEEFDVKMEDISFILDTSEGYSEYYSYKYKLANLEVLLEIEEWDFSISINSKEILSGSPQYLNYESLFDEIIIFKNLSFHLNLIN